jgi:hypothetical protein
VGPDACERCGRSGCLAYPYGDAKLMLECRDAELARTQELLAATRALLDRARLLLVKSRDAFDLAITQTQQEPAGGSE